MATATEPLTPGRGKPRVAAELALTLLEVIQSQDLPADVLQEEDVTQTMPRRLGLSEVIERQIRLHREHAKKGRRITDAEMTELMRLVLRRPDSPEIFFELGERLADDYPSRVGRKMPTALKMRLAKRGVIRRLKGLFGRRVGGFTAGPFVLEGSASPFVQADPGGDACQVVSGLCQGILRGYLGDGVLVVHQACETRGDTSCRWSMVKDAVPPPTASA